MRFDVIIIGSGQAGNPLSHALAGQGRTVALVEKEHLGGTCINMGCTPTKTMLMSAQVAHCARNAATWGVRPGDGAVDLRQIVARKNKVVESYRSGHEKKFEQRKKSLHLCPGLARFSGPNSVHVVDEELESDRILISTGTRTSTPAIDGLDRVGYLTNASVMELHAVPQHLLVLGGGYIGLELGQMFQRSGSRLART